MNLHPQLQTIVRGFESARDRMRALGAVVAGEAWSKRPEPDRWSVAECVGHLNLTASATLPVIREALARAKSLNEPAPPRYRHDFLGWLLLRSVQPTGRLKVKTSAAFVPVTHQDPEKIMEEFARFQDEQIACVHEAEGLAIQRVKIPSPFNSRLRYSLYSCLSIQPPHQHRHLRQAEEALRAITGSAVRG